MQQGPGLLLRDFLKRHLRVPFLFPFDLRASRVFPGCPVLRESLHNDHIKRRHIIFAALVPVAIRVAGPAVSR